jgi:hypothetical protein
VYKQRASRRVLQNSIYFRQKELQKKQEKKKRPRKRTFVGEIPVKFEASLGRNGGGVGVGVVDTVVTEFVTSYTPTPFRSIPILFNYPPRYGLYRPSPVLGD